MCIRRVKQNKNESNKLLHNVKKNLLTKLAPKVNNSVLCEVVKVPQIRGI